MSKVISEEFIVTKEIWEEFCKSLDIKRDPNFTFICTLRTNNNYKVWKIQW